MTPHTKNIKRKGRIAKATLKYVEVLQLTNPFNLIFYIMLGVPVFPFLYILIRKPSLSFNLNQDFPYKNNVGYKTRMLKHIQVHSSMITSQSFNLT